MTLPYGYRLTAAGRMVQHPDEQKVLRLVRKLRDEGATLREIADRLNAKGFRTRRGTEWRFQYVERMVKRG